MDLNFHNEVDVFLHNNAFLLGMKKIHQTSQTLNKFDCIYMHIYLFIYFIYLFNLLPLHLQQYYI